MPVQNNSQSRQEVAARLRAEAVGVKLERSQFGASRKVSSEQKERIAGLFGADSSQLSAGKKLLNKRNEAYKLVTSLLGQARELWLNSSLPYPEDGVRLIRRDRVERFSEQMEDIRSQLLTAAQALQEVYVSELIPEARERLGDLYNSADYPANIASEFDIGVSFPNVDPPEYLRQISPQLYEQERQRIQARFEESIALAEQNFAAELSKVVEQIIERMTPAADGSQKVFKESSIENVKELLGRFKSLDIGSNQALTDLMGQAELAMQGVDVKNLRKDVHARQSIKQAMEGLSRQLDGLMIDRPKRKITLEDDEPVAEQPAQEQAAVQGEEVAA